MYNWTPREATIEEQQASFDQYQLGLGEYFARRFTNAFERYNTLGILKEEHDIAVAEEEAGTYFDPKNGLDDDVTFNPEDLETNPNAMSEADFKAAGYDREGRIKWTPQTTPQRAQIEAETLDRRDYDAKILSRGEGWGRKAIGFGAGLLASLPDPINLLPIAGQAKLGATVGARILSGAKAGVLGTALADSFLLPMAARKGEDIGLDTIALDLTFGGLIGAGIGGTGGLLHSRRVRSMAEHERTLSSTLEGIGFEKGEAEMRAHEVINNLADTMNRSEKATHLRTMLGGMRREDAGLLLDKAVATLERDGDMDLGSWMKLLGAEDVQARAAALVQPRLMADMLEAVEKEGVPQVSLGRLSAETLASLENIERVGDMQITRDGNLVLPSNVIWTLFNKSDGLLKDHSNPNAIVDTLLEAARFDRTAPVAERDKTRAAQLAKLQDKMLDSGFFQRDPETGRIRINAETNIGSERKRLIEEMVAAGVDRPRAEMNAKLHVAQALAFQKAYGVDATKALNRRTFERIVKQIEMELEGEAANRKLYQFIGKKGATALDLAEETTARLDNLGVAREMEQAGKTPEAIKLATGWERGADGKWRYEIDDSIIRFSKSADMLRVGKNAEYARYKELADNLNNLSEQEWKEYSVLEDVWGGVEQRDMDNFMEHGAKLEDVIEAPELFEAYPDLRDVSVVFARPSAMEGSLGVWRNSSNTIFLNKNLLESAIGQEKRVLNVLLHETQHAIQHKEGFARGGNSEFFEGIVREFNDEIKFLRNNLAKLEEWSGIKDFVRESMRAVVGGEKTFADHWRDLDQFKKTNPDYLDNVEAIKRIEKEISDAIDVFKAEHGNAMTADEMYRHLMGEVEARNASRRMDMTPEERRNTLARSTEDVAREDQIFLETGHRAMAESHSKGQRPIDKSVTVEYVHDTGKPTDRVALPDGSDAFGTFEERTLNNGRHLPKGKIILERGVSHFGNGRGFLHIADAHGNEIRNAGYDSVQEFVWDLVNNFDEIWEGDGKSLTIVWNKRTKDGKKPAGFVELTKKGNAYSVKSAFPAEGIFPNPQKRKLLWRNAPPSSSTTGGSTPSFAQSSLDHRNPYRTPDGALHGQRGQSVDSNINTTETNSNSARGIVEFGNAEPGGAAETYRIFLSPDADASTIPHESAHIFLRELENVIEAAEGDSPYLDQARADMKTLRRAAGVAEEGKLSPGDYRKLQESTARMFEQYLSEGTAPNPALADVFTRMARWLKSIYEDVKAYVAGTDGVELKQEVREVFDRMLDADRWGRDADVHDASVPQPDFSRAAPRPTITPDTVEALNRASDDILNNMANTPLDIEATRIVNEGNVLPEHLEALELARAEEARVSQMEEAALSTLECIKGGV